MQPQPYVGRFAPTPSGPLHFGSIIAALGSFLQARKYQGTWLVRIEDIDEPRTKPGADKLILEQLERLGLQWDDDIVYQSERISRYQLALKKLESKHLVFPCSCSRKDTGNKPYSGTCRKALTDNKTNQSLRVLTNNELIKLNDLLQGDYSQRLESDVGDFIIKRADGYFAYHLAVVIDDAEQSVTEIVRGLDLLDSTPRQIYLQQLLELSTPSYLHLPLAIDFSGNKLSKATEAEAANTNDPVTTLIHALNFLGQTPPPALAKSNTSTVLEWAIENWEIKNIPSKKEIRVP